MRVGGRSAFKHLASLLSLLLVGSSVAAVIVLSASPASAVTAPPYGISVYVTTNSPTNLYNLGCQMGTVDKNRAGTQATKVALDFGGPTTVNGVQGATLFGGPNSTTSQILAAVKEYAHGYWVCTGSDTTSVAEVAVGTNNSTGSSVTTANGTAWANMVNSFGSWLNTVAYGNQVDAAGANDIEPGFGNPGPARNWVNGYASVNNYRYLNYGSADGCPTGHIPSSTECGTSTYPSWGPEDIYYVSWGAPPAWPLPEIYTTSGSQASQWYWLSRYAVQQHGTPMFYIGSFTQSKACQTRSCPGTNNSPSAGYTQLYNALAQNASTQQTPCCASDIKWYGD
jgi:hypothetical protein